MHEPQDWDVTPSVSEKQILVVDDDPISSAVVSEELQSIGYRVTLASDLKEAVFAAQKLSFAVVVTDLHMPHGGGEAVVRGVSRILPQASYVILTADETPNLDVGDEYDDEIVSIIHKGDRIGLTRAVSRAFRVYERPPSSQVEGGNYRVLLIEYDADSIAVAQAYLGDEVDLVHDFSCVSRLTEALHLLRERDFDVIIAELKLPDARGVDVVVGVRSVDEETPLIVLTSNTHESIGTDSLEAGAQDFLLKSATSQDSLRRAIRYAITRKHQEELLQTQVRHDELTGLANRTLLHERLASALARGRRSGKIFTVALLDLDGFKPVNDRFGHEAGDTVLCMVARILEEETRQEDTVARLGGDEFVLLLEDTTPGSDLESFMTRLIGRIGSPLEVFGQSVLVTASMGVASYPETADEADALLAAADRAMYRAKEEGKNRFSISTPLLALGD